MRGEKDAERKWVVFDPFKFRDQWLELWSDLGLSSEPLPVFSQLLMDYTSRDRHHHNIYRLESCLALFNTLEHLSRDPALVRLAIWYQDSVYDPARNDNEQRSAQRAKTELTRAGLSLHETRIISNLILSTRHQDKPIDSEQQLVADIDLHFLGLDHSSYLAHYHLIRAEHQFQKEKPFRRERLEFLGRLLERDTLFSTPQFNERFAASAYHNIRKELLHNKEKYKKADRLRLHL